MSSFPRSAPILSPGTEFYSCLQKQVEARRLSQVLQLPALGKKRLINPLGTFTPEPGFWHSLDLKINLFTELGNPCSP